MSESCPIVSIITPNFNGSRFLRQTIESVLAQSFENWEMLIVDDGSTDGSQKIIEEYTLFDKRIKFLKTDTIKFAKLCNGPAAPRNTAIDAARGRYIAFLDSDDIWHKEKLAKQLSFFQSNNYALTYTWYFIMSQEGKNVGAHEPYPLKQSYKDLLKECKMGCSSTMYDTNIVGKQYIDMNEFDQGADYSLWLKITKAGYDSYCLREKLSSYRLVKNSISANKIKAIKQQWRILRQVEKLNFSVAVYNFSFYAVLGIIKKIKYIPLRFL